MNPILKKLQYKDQNPVLIIGAPPEWSGVMKEIESEVHTRLSTDYTFIMVFVLSMGDLEKKIAGPANALAGDGTFWISYPKGTSKKYKSDANRDSIREAVEKYNYEAVSMVAIDDNWSALRIRKIKYIKGAS